MKESQTGKKGNWRFILRPFPSRFGLLVVLGVLGGLSESRRFGPRKTNKICAFAFLICGRLRGVASVCRLFAGGLGDFQKTFRFRKSKLKTRLPANSSAFGKHTGGGTKYQYVAPMTMTDVGFKVPRHPVLTTHALVVPPKTLER